jgi:hypothetical protein
MRLEQAIFTSARTNKLHGYHLIARSPGISPEMAQSLNRWGPSHSSLADLAVNTFSINFHPVVDNWFAISRSTYGGPEYSNRGGLQLYTRSVLFQRDQLAGYRFNPIALSRLLHALGLLRFQHATPDKLPVVNVPDRVSPSLLSVSKDHSYGLIIEQLLMLMEDAQAAVVGVADPLVVLSAILARMPDRDRLDLSFTTGLKPSIYRPFRLHFLSATDPAMQRQLNSQGIAVLAAQN